MVRVREVHVTMEAEVKEMPLLERSHQSSNSGSLYKLEETKDFLLLILHWKRALIYSCAENLFVLKSLFGQELISEI